MKENIERYLVGREGRRELVDRIEIRREYGWGV